MRDPSEAATETIKPSSSSSLTEATYSLQNEDHTLGNCLRYQLNKNPGVLVAGYSVPHPMERKVNVRVQTVAPVTADGAMREARSFVGCGERVRTRDGDVRGGVEGGTKDDDGGQKVVEREREREKE